MKKWIFLAIIFISFSMVNAHSGRTDSNGGHNCSAKSINKGLCSGYHYHTKNKDLSTNITDKVPQSKINSMPVVGPFSNLYDRDDWPHWIDLDRDCQNTRAEILIARSSLNVTFRNEKKCSVIAGSWLDPFSGKTWTKASDVDIDHIVPLKWAHGHGGQDWTKEKKTKFANDSENLLVVEDNLNQEKGAKSPDEWMPPNHYYRCEYAAKFDEIVNKYQLTYVPSEKRVIEKMLSNCKHDLNK